MAPLRFETRNLTGGVASRQPPCNATTARNRFQSMKLRNKPVSWTTWLFFGAALVLPQAACASGRISEQPSSEPVAEEVSSNEADVPVPPNASFTEAQARRGRGNFGELCGSCHSRSEFRGANFRFRWRRQTAWDFWVLVSQTMPENAPGSLRPSEYLDFVAYVLEMNGWEPGEGELEATERSLVSFPLDKEP